MDYNTDGNYIKLSELLSNIEKARNMKEPITIKQLIGKILIFHIQEENVFRIVLDQVGLDGLRDRGAPAHVDQLALYEPQEGHDHAFLFLFY